MHLSQLSHDLLKEAITQGTITLQNGNSYKLTSSQIITITKFLIQSTPPTLKIPQEDEDNIPEEMLLPFNSQDIKFFR